MWTASALLPSMDASDDKVFTTPNAVVVLDGASAFHPVPVPASTYADQLGRTVRDQLTEAPEQDLRDVLASAIQRTATELDLTPGDSPSSTVAIVRQRDAEVDTLVLGDSVIVLPDGVLTDERMDRLNMPERREYRQRLARGTGYDDEHKQLLRALQEHQARYRNRDGGYWIAEANPEAAYQAWTTIRALQRAPWAVLATDGIYNTAEHLGHEPWEAIADYNEEQLTELLNACQRWETETDPNGIDLPRSKRHDDKAIAAVRFG